MSRYLTTTRRYLPSSTAVEVVSVTRSPAGVYVAVLFPAPVAAVQWPSAWATGSSTFETYHCHPSVTSSSPDPTAPSVSSSPSGSLRMAVMGVPTSGWSRFIINLPGSFTSITITVTRVSAERARWSGSPAICSVARTVTWYMLSLPVATASSVSSAERVLSVGSS